MISLEDLRGKHSGKSAVVVGAGPSARLTPMDVRDRHIVLVVNEAISMFPNPDYFCARDRTILQARRYWPTILKSGCVNILFDSAGTVPILNHFDQERTVIMTMKSRWEMNARDKHVICGYSAQCAAHFAVMLGCSPIYLIGNECRYVDGKRQFSEFNTDGQSESDAIKSSEEVRDSFGMVQGINQEGEMSDSFLNLIFCAWLTISKKNPFVEIIDASDGRLGSVFPTIDASCL